MPRASNAIDKHVAGRLRLARLSRGLSQSALSNTIGVSFQQLQKYENGSNRLTAGKLFQLANLLGVEIGYFYEGMSTDQSAAERGFRVSRNEMLAIRKLSRVSSRASRQRIETMIDTILRGAR
jgi:transcriptional regulator with XRE-family HTH domain